MRKLSDTLRELGITFSFPIEIRNSNGRLTYRESSDGYWRKSEYDTEGNETYYENSDGVKRGTPRSSKSCDGTLKEVITQVSIKSKRADWHPIYNTIKVAPDDDAAGSYLKIVGEDEMNDGRSLALDWDEWDNLVETVAKYRNEWEWNERGEHEIFF